MNHRIVLILSILFFSTGIYSHGQKFIPSNRPAGYSYASKTVKKIYIPPPKEFYLNRGKKGATIQVYYSGFSAAAKTAYEYAVSILASVLPSNTNFTIRASYVPMSDNNILGGTSVTGYFDGSTINALNPYADYPVALAEKIAGKTLNADSEGDLIMSINSNTQWYTGTDGNTPVNKYDLVTVVLHELCHGIGFVDSFTQTGTIGSYGIFNNPAIYDRFVQDGSGFYLTDTIHYTNNTSKLGNELTTANIYFSGIVQNPRVRLYAPSTFSAGSSISHINPGSVLQQDGLMEPFISLAEAIHSPGKITMAILGDIGWINTRIIHTPYTDTEKNLSQVAFNAVIQSDTSFHKDQVGLVYSFNKFLTRDTIYLTPPLGGDIFSTSLNIPAYNTFLSYYFFAMDYFGRIYKLPSMGVSAPYTFYIGIDTVKPILKHKAPDYFIDKISLLKLKATASDNIGIDTVFIEYRKNNGTFTNQGMHHDSLDIYSNYLDIKSLGLSAIDSLQYRIIAVDSSSSANKSYSPATGYYTLKPEMTYNVAASYTTDFSGASNDFINHGFSIVTPSGFSDPALHTKHPYESPDKDGDSIVYSSVLRYPLKVDDSGINISFMEIVLVEPGEAGSVFGSPNFYDYVIVEGSKNFGETWFPMADGYDSRISSTFLSAYNSSMSGINSIYSGSPSMFAKHTIAVSTFNRFNIGDTLLIRFRLYSDPYAHGWGWAIDDLSIKSVVADVPKTEISDMRIYPNPGNGLIKFQQSDITGQEADYKVLNITGEVLKNGKIIPGDNELLDISSQPPGLYIIIVKLGNKVQTLRYTKMK
jgi:hypothetical protein